MPTLSHIAPPELRRQETLIREYKKIMTHTDLPIHEDITAASSSRLKSRLPTVKTAKKLCDDDFSISETWKHSWCQVVTPEVSSRLNPDNKPAGFDLPRRVWKIANRIRSNHGICRDSLHKWKKIADPLCSCGRGNQTIRHIVQDCEMTAYRTGTVNDFLDLPQTAVDWIDSMSVNI